MSLWSRVKDWFGSDAAQLTKIHIPEDGGIEATPNDSYFRVWLADMFLERDQEWLRDHYPSVHASVQLRYGNYEAAEFTRTARPPEGMLGPGILGDFSLTPLLPFNGGTVGLQGALTVVKGENPVTAALDVLQDFSKLVGPPLGEALGIASRVSNGLERLLNLGAADIQLGVHREFAAVGGGGSNVLAPGYHGLIRADHGTFTDDAFSVVDSRLHVSGTPLTGYDYMLFRIEVRRERDDWRLKDIMDLIRKAKDAWRGRDEEGWRSFGQAAIGLALAHPDLTQPDGERAAKSIQAELLRVKDFGLGAAPPDDPSLEEIVATHGPPIDEVGHSPRTLSDFKLD